MIIEGIIKAILVLTAEVRRMIKEEDPDLDVAETERLMKLVEDDLGYIRRWQERLRQGHAGGNG